MNAVAPHRGRKGFTVTELLVTIGILAILLLVALPVLSSGRETTASIRCMENLKRLGMAIFTYAADHDNRLIPGLYKDASSSLPWSRILNGLPGNNYLAPAAYPSSLAAQATGKTPFDCPARKAPATYDQLHFGYSAYPGFTIYDDAGVGLTRRLTDVQRPAQTMLLGEIPNGYRLLPYRIDLLELPHRGRMNAFYADGSIRAVGQPLKNANVASLDPQPPFY